MALTLLVPPAGEPLTLADTKLYLRVTDNSEDTLLAVLIAGARQAAEHALNRVLVTQTWELRLDGFPSVIALPRNPVQSVTQVTYRDSAGVLQQLPAESYYLNASSLVATVHPAYGTAWPAARNEPQAVSVVFVAGYGEGPDSVPATVRQWMLAQITHWYDHRSASDTGDLSATPFLSGLLDSCRVPQL